MVLLVALLFTLIYGVLGFYLLDRHFIVNGQQVSFSLWDAIRQTVVMFTQFYNPGLVPATRFGKYFVGSIYIVGAVTIGYALIMLIRPVLVHRGATPQEMQKAKEIVEAYGHSSLARLAVAGRQAVLLQPGRVGDRL